MNEAEARARFRSSAKGRDDAPPPPTLEEAKFKFREAAAELDKKTGLDNLVHGPWGKGITFFITLISSLKAQTWVLPLFSGLLRAGGKTIDFVLGLLTSKKKGSRVTLRRKT